MKKSFLMSLMMWILLYLYNVAVAFDQLGNALLGRAADQTISAHAWHAEQEGRLWGQILRPFIDFLFAWIESNHCKKAFYTDPTERLNSVSRMHRRWQRGEKIIARINYNCPD